MTSYINIKSQIQSNLHYKERVNLRRYIVGFEGFEGFTCELQWTLNVVLHKDFAIIIVVPLLLLPSSSTFTHLLGVTHYIVDIKLYIELINTLGDIVQSDRSCKQVRWSN